MNRRGFLKSMLAAGAGAAIITTPGLLMPVRKIWTPAWVAGPTHSLTNYFPDPKIAPAMRSDVLHLNQAGVDARFTAMEFTLKINEFSKRIICPVVLS